MLAADAESDETRGDAAEEWNRGQCPDDPRCAHALSGATEYAADDAVLNHELRALNDAGWHLASLLDSLQDVGSDSATFAQSWNEKVGCCDCILNREIDSDAADG